MSLTWIATACPVIAVHMVGQNRTTAYVLMSACHKSSASHMAAQAALGMPAGSAHTAEADEWRQAAIWHTERRVWSSEASAFLEALSHCHLLLTWLSQEALRP